MAEVLNKSGVKGGLVVHVGCGDGKVTADLLINDRFLVQGLDKDPKKVAAARKHIHSLGLYGRVSVDHFDGIHLPYADNLVNLLIVSTKFNVQQAEIERVLAPRGVALIDGKKLVKPVPPELGEWTHYLHGPDNNAVSKDTKVAFPKYLQWRADPVWGRHHATAQGVEAVVSSKGRLFYIVDDAEASIGDSLPDQWNLVARDAFNGVELWRRPLGEFSWKMWTTGSHVDGRMGYPKQRHRRLVAVGDRVYATLGFESPVSVLDAATGEVIRTLAGTELCSEVVFYKDILFLSIRSGKGEAARYRIMAVNPESGKTMWTSGSYKGFPGKYPGLADLSLLAADNYVVFQDEKATVCLDIKTGRELWSSGASYAYEPAASGAASDESTGKKKKNKKSKKKKSKKKDPNKPLKYKMGGYCRLIYHDGVVYLQNPYAAPNLSAVSAKTGKTLWQKHETIIVYGTSSQMFTARNLLWVWIGRDMLGGLDLKTGAVKKEIPMADALSASVGHIRCYPEKGTENTLWTTIGGKDQQMVDLKTGKISSMPWLRGACRIGILPCNGFIYMTPHPCMCHSEIKLKGFLALAGSKSNKAGSTGVARLERGSACGKIQSLAAGSAGDWPEFRHDGSRENTASTAIGKSLKLSWEAGIKGRLTQPVVANGMVYVASIDQHMLCALDENTGKQVWTCFAGGRIDSAPTFYKGRVLFGSADGHVYCVSAKDGSLAWKFRAAPGRRNIVARGQLESAWPVHGSILVHDGKVAVVAGRSSYLDGGLYMTLLDPDTGKVLKESNMNTTGLELSADWAPGALSDVLVAKGKSVYMYFSELSLNGPEIKVLEDGTDLIKGGPGSASKAKSDSMFLTGAGGMLQNGFFHRAGMMYGKSWGQIMALDGESSYAVRLFPNWNNHNGPTFVHGIDKAKLVKADPASVKTTWAVDIPLIPRAIITAGDKVIVGGAPDEIDPDDPWKGYEGRSTGKIIFYSKRDGSALGGCELSSVPVTDGISAANNKLLISLKDGNVQCWR